MGLKAKISRLLPRQPLSHLRRNVIELNSYRELQKIFAWQQEPLLDRPDIYDFEYVEDANERRVRDAESLALVMRNVRPSIALEIGTSNGMGTALMAANAPESNIYTVNIPPEEVLSGAGGTYTTIALEREKIGLEYRKRNFTNITQIYANTASWEPDFGPVGVAYIDGCHDSDFVYNDTRKILRRMEPGSFILWHDFNPELADKFEWIYTVCRGVDRLYRDGLIKGRMFHLRDSWVGIYKVGEV